MIQLFLLFFNFTFASDNDFLFVKPMDENVAHTFLSTDTKLSETLSDGLVISMVTLPLFSTVGESDGWNRALGLGAAYGSTILLTNLAKRSSDRTRPDGSDQRSFWSGHTATAFVGAGYLCAYEKRFCWSGLAVASTAGFLRISAGKHWLSDVFTGALVGYMIGRQVPLFVGSF